MNNRRLIIVMIMLMVFSLQALHAGEVLVLSSVNVISMVDGEVQHDRDVIIRNGKILEIVPAAKNRVSDAHTVDGKSGWLIPGLAEMHAHIPSRSSGEQRARDVLGLYLANGITTARGMLGEPWHLELRAALEAQTDWLGPRLITSGPSFNGNSVSSAEQAAQRVRDQHAAGYDFLKLHPGLKADEFESIANTAHELGITFGGHVSNDVGLNATLRQRQATIDHLDGYAAPMVPQDSELAGQGPEFFGVNLAAALDTQRAVPLAKATAEAGVWNVPTQSLLENLAGETPVTDLLNRPGMTYVSSEVIENWTNQVNEFRARMTSQNRQRFLDSRHALIRELQNSGAGLLLGSDAPQIMNVPGFSIHEELDFMVLAGLSPLQALQSGTINVARFFDRENSGDVQAGFDADLVLLSENPLENIAASRAIIGVIRAGTWYDRKALDQWLADIHTRKL